MPRNSVFRKHQRYSVRICSRKFVYCQFNWDMWCHVRELSFVNVTMIIFHACNWSDAIGCEQLVEVNVLYIRTRLKKLIPSRKVSYLRRTSRRSNKSHVSNIPVHVLNALESSVSPNDLFWHENLRCKSNVWPVNRPESSIDDAWFYAMSWS